MVKKQWFYGKNVVLSGASSGIGLELAKLLVVKYGCTVVGLGRSDERLKKAQEEISKFSSKYANSCEGKFIAKTMDVARFEAWKELEIYLQKEDIKIDVLINNAGVILPFEKFENQSIDDAKNVFEINFFAHLYSYKTFVDELKNRRGSIINISSSSALCPVVGEAIYSASKAACRSFTEVISLEHKKEIYIASVCPGYTKTDLFRNEKEVSKLVNSVSMKASKMAKKIIRKIAKKRKRIVLGIDAHLMSGLYRIAPKATPATIASVLKTSKDKMFDGVFPENIKKRKNK